MASYTIKPSIKGVILWYGISLLLVAATVIFIVTREAAPPALWALLAVPLAIDVWASAKHVRINARKLTLEDGVLRYEDGLVSKKQRSILLDKVRDVRTEQTLAQRLAGVGDLSVEALGEAGSITLHNVDRPVEAAQRILGAMKSATNKGRLEGA